jgi:hypothetical protein
MTSPPATVLMVFGRGVVTAGGGHALTPASAARVQAAVEYIAAHEAAYATQGRRPRIIFSGGWAEACEGADAPPVGCREGDLMLARAHAAGLERHADLCAETRSRSTLENLLHTLEDGLLAGHAFDARHPLGLVSHAWHLPRVRFLAGKVFRLRGAALLDVRATGGEAAGPWGSAHALHLASRLCFLGARDAPALLRRERRAVATMRRAEQMRRAEHWTRRRPAL